MDFTSVSRKKVPVYVFFWFLSVLSPLCLYRAEHAV